VFVFKWMLSPETLKINLNYDSKMMARVSEFDLRHMNTPLSAVTHRLVARRIRALWSAAARRRFRNR
jgi:hypothetical protein